MGDILTLADGTTAPVSDTYGEQLDEPVIVYNFEVSDFHTYYFTDTGVLVHNDKCDREKILADNRKKGKLAQEKRHNELIESHPETKQEITIRPFDDNGELVDYNVRVDELTNSFFNEVKASESAPYTPNQLNGYLLLQRNGGR